jgi:hypothetical protein
MQLSAQENFTSIKLPLRMYVLMLSRRLKSMKLCRVSSHVHVLKRTDFSRTNSVRIFRILFLPEYKKIFFSFLSWKMCWREEVCFIVVHTVKHVLYRYFPKNWRLKGRLLYMKSSIQVNTAHYTGKEYRHYRKSGPTLQQTMFECLKQSETKCFKLFYTTPTTIYQTWPTTFLIVIMSYSHEEFSGCIPILWQQLFLSLKTLQSITGDQIRNFEQISEKSLHQKKGFLLHSTVKSTIRIYSFTYN